MSSALLIATALVPGRALAQQSDTDAVKAAAMSFQEAITSLDLTKMEPLLAHESYVTWIAPLQNHIAVGYDEAMKRFEATTKMMEQLKLSFTEGPHIHVNGNVAWLTGIVLGEGKLKNGKVTKDNVFESDVFEKQNGRWLVVSHSATRLPE
jgi:ketosteroid isomerase-like protein